MEMFWGISSQTEHECKPLLFDLFFRFIFDINEKEQLAEPDSVQANARPD